MSDSVVNFYDELAQHYTLIFQEWDTSVQRQGEVLDKFIRAHFTPSASALPELDADEDTPTEPITAPFNAADVRVLDCACGIGTQAIGLALHGYQVHATDISAGAIDEARKHAQRLNAALTFDVADMRTLQKQVEGEYDLVVAFDNALPHLLHDEELALAAQHVYAKIRPGGLFIASIRDYDAILLDKPQSTEPRVYDSGGERRIIFQVWDWEGSLYTLQHFIVRGSGSTWVTHHAETQYRALRRDELTAFLAIAGFDSIKWHMPDTSGYYQPIVTARRG
ncbi:MAG: class I SAM-dependent methyltransferase [Anaerolineae bacterium]